jgi:hypothetical protein
VEIMAPKWMRTYCVIGLVLFAALSVMDLVQTWELIESRRGLIKGGHVTEGNPFAAEWLKQYDWRGLSVYKAASVLAVVACVALLTRYRPFAGALVVTFACLVLIMVTNYSRDLLEQPLPRRQASESWDKRPTAERSMAMPFIPKLIISAWTL